MLASSCYDGQAEKGPHIIDCPQGMARHCSGESGRQLPGQSGREAALLWLWCLWPASHPPSVLSAGSLALFPLCTHASGSSLQLQVSGFPASGWAPMLL